MQNQAKSKTFFSHLLSWKMLLMLALGFSSGVPFLVIKDILKAWLTESGRNITEIGLFSAVSLPYTYKFVWSPFMDRYQMPFLTRRRGWIVLAQVCLLISISFMGQWDPKESLTGITITALAIAFFAASQDIVLDAFRREILSDKEIGPAISIWSNGYRLGNLASIGVAFTLASKIGYEKTYWFVGALMVVGIIFTLLASEDPKSVNLAPKTLKEAVVDPFREFFKRKEAYWLLGFILLYKIGDNMASALTVPFILETGFSKQDYLFVVKGVGMVSLFGGMLLGGVLMVPLGLSRALWIFGVLQMISTLGYGFLGMTGQNYSVFTGVIVFELLTMGLGATAYSSLLTVKTHRKFTATQFALMTSLMAVPATVAAAFTGYIKQGMGSWPGFFTVCALSAVPGMLILFKIAPWGKEIKSAE